MVELTPGNGLRASIAARQLGLRDGRAAAALRYVHDMARRVSEERQRAAAILDAQRMVARGERPVYHVTTGEDGALAISELPWVVVPIVQARGAMDAARAAIAEALDILDGSFDLERA